jgi:hypothetical protein
LSNQREECGFIDIFDDFCPDLPVPSEDPKDRLLRCSPASFGSRFPDNLPFILPGFSEIGFINLDRSGEDVRYILR